MPQIFHPSMNTISRVSIFGALFFLVGGVFLLAAVERSPYVTEVGVVQEQPVPFSHEHHVGDVGIDCRYCHTDVETSAYAGMPPTETCMNCHSQLFSDSPMLEPVRASMRSASLYDGPACMICQTLSILTIAFTLLKVSPVSIVTVMFQKCL